MTARYVTRYVVTCRECFFESLLTDYEQSIVSSMRHEDHTGHITDLATRHVKAEGED